MIIPMRFFFILKYFILIYNLFLLYNYSIYDNETIIHFIRYNLNEYNLLFKMSGRGMIIFLLLVIIYYKYDKNIINICIFTYLQIYLLNSLSYIYLVSHNLCLNINMSYSEYLYSVIIYYFIFNLLLFIEVKYMIKRL
jgi:hypothetical protein